MKKFSTAAVILCTALFFTVTWTASADTSSGENSPITIVFSHDMHSHLEKFPKIRTVVKQEKQNNDATFVLDGGDFSMGTPYQTIFKEEAAELRMMGAVGYDATTLGNHEFDYRSAGLTQMLKTAESSGDRVPHLVAANIDWEKTLSDEEMRKDGEALRAAMEDYGAEEYVVIERGGVKIAVFGLFGKEADDYAPESGTYFRDPVEAAKDVVDDIQSHEKVDLIVCLSHSGTNADDPEKSEDEILARQVDGIDLIISGHTHTELSEPIVRGDTVIASAGQYNDNLGTLTFTYQDGEYKLDQYRLISLDKSVQDDPSAKDKVEQFRELVDEEYFSAFDYSWDQVLADNQVKFTSIDDFASEQGEDPLGSLIADSYRYGVKQAEGSEYEQVDVAIAPAGVIRGSFDKGEITVGDAFNALSLGTGKDGEPGYPLVSVYLTGAELKLAAEIDISISELMQPARLYFSGLNYTYNPHRLILNRAYDIVLDRGDGETEPLKNDKLYRVVADLYSAQMLGTVNSLSYGLLSVEPKDKEGNVIENFEDYIIYDRQGGELKEWYALASYIDSFDGNQVSERYGKPEGRKILRDSWNIIDLVKKPNKFFWMITAAVALVLSLIALIVILIVKIVKHITGGGKRIRRKDMIFRR
ncbi:MAG: bifunctional metallophosphatase/5'-nucleotidase [Anaerovoracaceae bacterium]